MTHDWEDQMISDTQDYASMELVLLLLMLTANLDIWIHRTENEENRVLVIFASILEQMKHLQNDVGQVISL